ncbi:hypothetical protein KJ059_13600 [Myxococcota bacterium]|nr:hypothetical protein [Myxococcota bacterium]MCZ7617800.1 queuosine salvage family protein [Myxococcota bacterium]
MSLFDDVRGAAARVVQHARSVRIDAAALAALASQLRIDPPPPPSWDPVAYHVGTPATRLAYGITLDAINFGSGWFPKLRKRAGRSGYYTVALGLKDRFDAHGPWSAAELSVLTATDLAETTGQTLTDPDVAELMALFARALNDLGRLLAEHHGGSFEALVADAGGSAERLVRSLARMPLYRDVSWYEGPAGARFAVPFYKRAQITVADLAIAFGGAGPGRFDDLDALTCFADNLVPHVLRCAGVLDYAPALAARIAAEQLLPPGAPEEVEIRAAGVHAVEQLVAALRATGTPASAHQIDMTLWHRGQRPEIKARPRHRSRCPYY